MLTVGLLGGMGPAATVDFMARLVRLTPARSDQQHLRLLVDCDPSVPDRSAHILRGSDAPATHLARMAAGLEANGAELLVIVCNTAHAYYDRVATAVRVPVVDWIAEVALEVAAVGVSRAGILATEGTLRAGLYDTALARHGVTAVAPSPAEQRALMEVIYGVKAGGPEAVLALRMRAVAAALAGRGAEIALLACTELSVLAARFPVIGGVREVDAADVVAARVVRAAGAIPKGSLREPALPPRSRSP
jgi:aspartate racemase